MLDDGVEQRRDAVGLGHIRRHGERLRFGRQLRQGGLERLEPTAREHDAVAGAGQPPCDRPPDPQPAPVTIATGACPGVLIRRFSVIVAPSVSQPLSSTVVGSYPQPEWLIDREALGSHSVPRVRVSQAWRIPEPYLREAQDDATVVAIRDMERAGIDTITDGEIRRESYSNRFATALDGVDADNPATIHTAGGEAPDRASDRRGRCGGAARSRCGDIEFLRAHTDRKTKITLPGPFTMAQQASNEAYDDPDELVMDFAAAVNEEALALQAAGADVIQLDEPWLRNDPDAARRIAVAAIDRALDGPVGHDRRAPVLRLRGAGRRQEPEPATRSSAS